MRGIFKQNHNNLRKYHKALLTIVLLISTQVILSAQSGTASSGFLFYSLLGVGILVALGAIISLADNLLKVEASKVGLDIVKNDIGILPSVSNMLSGKKPKFAGENSFKKLSKGFDIKLTGEAPLTVKENTASRFAICPTDFNGMSPIPKVVVEVGDIVKAGDVLFFDKKVSEIMYTSPVSGEIIEVNRGEKRSISEVVILADINQQYKNFDVPSLSSEISTVVSFLQESGAWTLFNQRPFDIVPGLKDLPRDVFVSTFDTAPLAPDANFVIKGNEAYFQKGIDVLNKLTLGAVHLGLNGNVGAEISDAYKNAVGAKKHYFAGKHPAGNVGVQIHHIKAIKSGDKVWTLGVQEVVTLGKLFAEGIWDASRVIAITGSKLLEPTYIKTFVGAQVSELLKNNIKTTEKKARYISGDVLSGKQKSENQYLSYKADQITVIEEGDDYELLGWLLPLKPRPSASGTFPNFLFPNYKFDANTNMHGEKRAFVVSGQYEEVLPMDIYPQQLMKAIITNDFEKMEGLGILELSEEDIALCEFVCTSKSPLQKTLREGLDIVQSQG